MFGFIDKDISVKSIFSNTYAPFRFQNGLLEPGPTGSTGPTGSSSTSGSGGTGATGPSGAPSTVTGPTGAPSTVTGPAGPTGTPSTVTGPTGAPSTVTGPTGSTGPAGQDSIVTGPTGPAGIVSVGTFGATGAANGLTISGSSIILEPATTTTPGAVTIGSQSFAGTKTFSGPVNFAHQTIDSTAGPNQTIVLGPSYIFIDNSYSLTLVLPDATATDGCVLWLRNLFTGTIGLTSYNLIYDLQNVGSNDYYTTPITKTLQLYFRSPNWYILSVA